MSDYLKKQVLFPRIIKEEPKGNLFNIVVVPCFNEPNISGVLNSLGRCSPVDRYVEVIIVINASEGASKDILDQNKKSKLSIEEFLKTHNSDLFTVHIIEQNQLPKKHAGVGLARKIGMDEAIYRFEHLARVQEKDVDGIITCLDADCTVAVNYLKCIEDTFIRDLNCPGVSINYAHDVFRNENSEEIINYELHLRYYNQGLKYAGFPFAYHTVGSSMAVRQEVYKKQGGMNKRKAGEDFYFLHKFIKLDGFGHIGKTTVFPSSRISDRVPFGTGRAIGEMKRDNTRMSTYPFLAFEDLKLFVSQLRGLYDAKGSLEQWLDNQPESLRIYIIKQNKYKSDWHKIYNNSANYPGFLKRFFQWMSAFWVMKFLNDYRNINGGEGVVSQACILLSKIPGKTKGNVSALHLLKTYRDLDNI